MADNTTNNKIKTTVELDVNQVQQKIAKLNSSASDSTKKLEDRIRDKNKEVELQNQLSQKTISALKKEQLSLAKSGGSLKQVAIATKKLNAERLKAVKISARNTKQQNKLNASTKNSGKGFGLFGKGLAGAKVGVLGMIPALGGLTAAIASTGIGAIVIAIAALGIGMISAIKTGAKFAKSLSGLKAISGATKNEMTLLSDQAKELGSTTAFMASEVVGLQTEFAKLGFSVREISESTPAVLDLAASLDVDLASAAEFAGSTIKSFGLETTDTQMVVDLLAKSAASSAQDFGTLVESFKLAAPSARALGISVKDTSVYLGALANNGLKGSIAGTGLSKSFIMLHKKGMTLNQGLEAVRNSSDGLTTAIDLVGIIGAKSLLTLANSGKDIEKLGKDLENVEGGALGAAKAMAELKLDNLAGDTTKLSSAWEGFMLGLEDGSGGLNDIARGAVQLLTKGITALGLAVDITAFVFKDFWHKTKALSSAGADFLAGSFIGIGAGIKLFANKAILLFAEIPIIGKAIDKTAIQANIKEAEEALIRGGERMAKATKTLAEQSLRDATTALRFAESQKAATLSQSNLVAKKEAEKAAAEKAVVDEKAAKKANALREKQAKEVADFKKKLNKDTEDSDAITKSEKLELERERHLKELDQLKLDKAEKNALEKQINALYDKEEADLQIERDLIDKEILLEVEAVEMARLLENDKLLTDERIKIQTDYLERKRLLDIESAKGNADEIEKINKKSEAAKAKITKAEEAAQKKSAKAELDENVNTALESFGIAQEVSVAKMIMNAPEAIGNSFTTAAEHYPAPLSLAMGALGAAGVVVPIMKGLGDIKNTRFSARGKTSGGGGGGGSINTSSIGRASAVGQKAVDDLSANNASRIGTDTSLSNNATTSALNNSAVGGSNSQQVVFAENSYTNFRNQIRFREDKSTI